LPTTIYKGTLSEHASGMAVDLDDSKNAQLTKEEWAFIESLVGKHVNRSGRWTTEANAESLWKDINEVSGLFVKKVAAEAARIEQARSEKVKAEIPVANSATSHPVKLQPVIAPLKEILGGHFKRLSPWVTTGFIHRRSSWFSNYTATGSRGASPSKTPTSIISSLTSSPASSLRRWSDAAQ
jgi:hypothetical protein